MANEGYFHRSLIALDTFANVVLGGNPDETISSRSQRAAARGDLWGRFMVWWLDKLQPNHGTLAEEGDLERAKNIEAIETKELNNPVVKTGASYHICDGSERND